LLRDVIRMLLAGVVHGDLSDFNVLVDPDGPVIIDFPQAVDPAHNRSAEKLFVRDVDNVVSFFARWDPSLRRKQFGREIWQLYEKNELHPDVKLTGKAQRKKMKGPMSALLQELEELEAASLARREALGLGPPRGRAAVVYEEPEPVAPAEDKPRKKRRKNRRDRKGGREHAQQASASPKRDTRPRAAKPQAAADPFDDLDALLIESD